MEVYRNSTTSAVFLEVPMDVISGGPAVIVKALENNVEVYEWATVIGVTGPPSGYSVTLPWELMREDRDFIVEWTVTYLEAGVEKVYSDRQLVQVITPILPLEEVARIAEEATVTDDVRDLERRVRYAIQSYTGQNFGKYRTTIEVRGTGSSKLLLPAPLLSISAANFNFAKIEFYNGGFAIAYPQNTWFGIKDAPPEDILDQFYYTNGPISVRNTYSFPEDKRYKIQGVWGYYDVPEDVKQAARLLVADYSCDESLWRDRYMDSVRAGNWRFEVNELAFGGTGNASVDALIAKYRRSSLLAV